MQSKYLLTVLLAFALPLSLFSQTTNNLQLPTSVNNDGSPPAPSAMLDVQADDKGMLVPRMTSAQRTAIASPATGLLVFDMDTGGFWFYNGTAWADLSAATSAQIADADDDTGIQTEQTPDDDRIRFRVRNNEAMVIDTSGNIGLGTNTPSFTLDMVGPNPGEGTNLQMTNSDRTQFLRLFGGHTNDPLPFLNWQDGSPLRFTTSNNDFSGWMERMRITSDGTMSIGNENPDPSAALEVSATGKGLLTPRMTTAQRNAIASPATGLLVYDTDKKSFWYYDNSVWNEIPTTMVVPGEEGSAAPALAIPDGDPVGVSDTITLAQPGVIDDNTQISVCVNITHTWVGDLKISLIGPDGTTIDLSSFNGGSEDNYSNTCFSTAANINITSGTAPFAGSWIPEQPFSNFYTKPIAGPWILNVADNWTTYNGTFDSWSIEIAPGSAAPSLLSDKDGDTRIQVEKNLDDDFIRFDVRGSQKAVIDNLGRVGIGTPTPQSQLEVKFPFNTTDTSNGIQLDAGNRRWRMTVGGDQTNNPANFQLLFKNQANPHVPYLTVNSIGSLGIGTNTPMNRLDVEGGLAVGAAYSGTNAAPADGAIIQGNVGVGVNNPLASLHAKTDLRVGTTTASLIAIGNTTPSTTVGGSNNASVLTTAGTAQGAFHFGIEVPSNDANDGFYIATDSNQDGIADKLAMKIRADGKVGIGTHNMAAGYALSVDGKVACEEVLVELSANWPDYVFQQDYELKSLEEVQRHIAEKGHLPGIPSAKEIEENGLEIGEMNRLLVEKVEELTLHLIAQQKQLDEQRLLIDQLIKNAQR